jgi:hypothetical protein
LGEEAAAADHQVEEKQVVAGLAKHTSFFLYLSLHRVAKLLLLDQEELEEQVAELILELLEEQLLLAHLFQVVEVTEDQEVELQQVVEAVEGVALMVQELIQGITVSPEAMAAMECIQMRVEVVEAHILEKEELVETILLEQRQQDMAQVEAEVEVRLVVVVQEAEEFA